PAKIRPGSPAPTMGPGTKLVTKPKLSVTTEPTPLTNTRSPPGNGWVASSAPLRIILWVLATTSRSKGPMLGLYVNGVLAGKVMFTPLCVDWSEKMVVKLAPMLLANVVESEPTGFALYARLIV